MKALLTPTIQLRGISGKQHEFRVEDLLDAPAVSCVYIVCKKIEGKIPSFDYVYAGQCDDLRKELRDHPQQAAFTERDAHTVLVRYAEAVNAKREAILSDLKLATGLQPVL